MKILERIRREHGAADPVLTIGAVAVSLIVASGIVTAIIGLLQLGSGFIAEQQASTQLAQARDAFARDADNASGVSVATTGPGGKVTFYETPSGSGIATNRNVAGCRIAQWSSIPATDGKRFEIEGRVRVTKDPTCKSEPAATDKGTPLNRVTGLVSAPTLGVVNAAGRTVTFNAGMSGAPTETKPAGWYTDVEWNSSRPKTLTWLGKTELEISGKRDAQLQGVTHLGEDHAMTSPGTIIEPQPRADAYDPAPSKPTITRGTLKTSVKSGLDESIHITWPQIFCGPYSVKYDVSFRSSTRGTTRSVASITTYGASKLVADLDGVANGEIGTVDVKTSCPPSVSTKPVTASTAYTQTLPKPTLSAARLTDDVHRLTWSTDISSLPLVFQPQGKHGTESAFYRPSATSDPGMTWTWPVGATYGRSDYAVVASVAGGARSALSDISSVTIAWPAIPTTRPWSYDNGSGSVHDNALGWSAAYCPAGTTIDYNPVVSGTARGWRTSLSMTVSVRYSTTYSASIQTRCRSPYEYSGTAVGPTIYWTTNPAPPATPTGCYAPTFSVSSDGRALNRLSLRCDLMANATSYTGYAMTYWAGSLPVSTGTSSSSTSSITVAACMTNSGHGLSSITGFMQARGASGTSGWRSWSLGVAQATRGSGCF